MRERFLTYIRENDMLDPGGRVIVALSGGGDSVCLLHLLASCREELEIHLLAVHVHHGIRGNEAGRDADFSRALCERLGVPFILRREDVPELAARRGLSLEEAAARRATGFSRRSACAAARPASRWPTTWTTARRPY